LNGAAFLLALTSAFNTSGILYISKRTVSAKTSVLSRPVHGF